MNLSDYLGGGVNSAPEPKRGLCRLWAVVVAGLMAGLAFDLQAADAAKLIQLDATSPGRVFEGVGAVSAGASTRLLPDYPEPQRGQILDFLFKPRFGAGFQHLKVEIGSGENSTCGSEPSHVVTREELANPQPRGYEFWLMAEARKRNPQIILDCLPWAYPHWVGDRFSPASADWFAAFLETARQHYGLELDWIAAAQNEMGTDLNWIRRSLRPKLDARGFAKVKLQAPDNNGDHWQIFNALEKDPELDRLIGAVGYHYLDGRDPWEIDQKGGPAATEKAKRSGKPLWASEEWSQSGGQWGDKGALYLARLMNKIYTRDRVTKFEIWCPIASIYDQVIWSGTGAMQADTPWCGHYTVWPAVWALAHTTQFAEPGWVYLDGACGQMDTNTWRGSHVALRNPKTGDWSVIIVTGEKRTIHLTLLPGLKDGPVHVWKSTAAAQFIEQPTLSLRNHTVELEIDADAIYTLTTTIGQQKGSHGASPPRKPFPFPFEETFESYHAGDTPRYFSDQKGTFEVCQSPKGGLCLAQIVPAEGIRWFAKLLKPHTLFGDSNWQDCVIEADVLLAGGDVEIGGRYADRDKLGYRWILARDGRWQLNWQSTSLASGQIIGFKPAEWHHLRLEMRGARISGAVDGKSLAAVNDAARAKGMAYLASTYDRNLFDNVRVGPLPAKGLEAAVPAPADFWVRDQPGRITHLGPATEPLVMCLQGRKVVMQVQSDSTNGFSYTARFFNLQSQVEKKKVAFVAGDESRPEVRVNDRLLRSDFPSSVTFDGLLTLTYPASGSVAVTRTVYPSMTKALVIEEWQLRNASAESVAVTVAPARKARPVGENIAIVWNCPEVKTTVVEAGGVLSFATYVQARLAAEPDLAVNTALERGARRAVAEAAWSGPGRLETPDPGLDVAFALQKLHVLENPIETTQGVITHNGSLTYSPGIWANDPVEYSSPVFPFFGDAELNRASMNMYRVWQDYCQEKGIVPFPGSFEGPGLKLTQRERGDDAMVLYGLSSFLLFQGDHAAAEELWPLIEFSAASLLRHTTAEGIIASRTDEMEGRYPTGAANLSTSSLAYGGYRQAARLAQALGRPVAAELDRRGAALRQGIETYFGADLEGFPTYRYYKENTTLRGWILLPLAMGITERQEATATALLSDKLWPHRLTGADILAESTRPTEWGRETYYALRVLFKAGRTEDALELTRRVVQAQVFGSKGPYPDEDAIDMLCPGSLYPRVFTEGMFGIVPTGLDSFECTPWLPKDWPRMALRDLRAFGRAWDLVVERAGDQQKVTVRSAAKTVMSGFGPAGKTYAVTFSNGTKSP